jgi:hypothetical protein
VLAGRPAGMRDSPQDLLPGHARFSWPSRYSALSLIEIVALEKKIAR